ncbi:zinc-dependent alcohol dehydrogenase family protein [Mucilaginibacter sp. SMC90]|uniref:zinc-dependent alcohol dehydrogenase family protein n=1 Tax=Mucilaginibacter sp. SMC90 TaxID=2929803 RepID=UPI001FB31A8B|nr:zinc-dependent alcohol dehydrogenase family protein [Mucilaginibacter sp. SMC90]UOE49527.1 zinc-dependent alcohol dehydrogenase family protein [Mucilaginibacter sp. SMC90]
MENQNKPTMQALIATEANAPFTLTEVERPVLSDNQVLVRIAASGVSVLDNKIRTGKGGHAKQPLPAILGMDFAGVIEAVGAAVTRFKAGDEVYGLAGGIGGLQGTYAQYAAFDADLLAVKPAKLSMRQSASMPLNFITAWEGLVDRANVHEGQKVLVHGGAGGVGHLAVQIAKALGADVYATGSAAQQQYIESIGAVFIDYREKTVEQYVNEYTGGEGFDIVYDTLGGATLDASFAAAKYYTGHVVSCLGWGEHKLAPLSFRGATYSGVFTLMPMISGRGRKHHGEIMQAATKLAEAGKIVPLVDERSFTLATANEAHDILENGKANGKLVIDVAE